MLSLSKHEGCPATMKKAASRAAFFATRMVPYRLLIGT
jgi:hypothetical protein